MHPNCSSISSPLALFLFLFAFIRIPITLCADDPLYSDCSTTITCGSIANIGYPFWGINRAIYCGQAGFELKCEDDVAKIAMGQNTLRILDVNPRLQILKVAREDYWNGYCPAELINTTISFNHFDYGSSLRNLTLCYSSMTWALSFERTNCTIDGKIMDVAYALTSVLIDPFQRACDASVIVPIYETAAQNLGGRTSTINDALRGGFELQWEVDSDQCRRCSDSDGVCGYNQTTNSFICFCRDQPSETTCSPTQGIAGAVAISIVFLYSIFFWRKKLREKQNVKAFIEKYGSLALKRYSYSAVKKMTEKFEHKLGQGGFGSVYRGKLPDGHLVAVKVLSESKGNGEDFINEVASISRTSHVNIVALLGFCYDSSKRALIYDYMPNGSLDRFIYENKRLNTRCNLEWRTLYQITIGIARGLEYLHQGCNTRILHFDIKPHNILLDEDFCPKISDFGLSKLCQRKESIVSMLGARGTAGYMAPEVYNRIYGGVSYKSDVYSFGMMVLEMVGGRRNIDVAISHTSEIYFPDWIYKQLEVGQDLNLPDVMTQDDERIARKMILVSLWCIQTSPSRRPSMTKVIEMLEGSLESLQFPPQPFFSFPFREQQNSSPSSTS